MSRRPILKHVLKTSVAGLSALLICAAARAGELHPIVEVQNGYLFGATADGKWIKAEEAAKALRGETTYRIYGLTQSSVKPREANRNRQKRKCVQTY